MGTEPPPDDPPQAEKKSESTRVSRMTMGGKKVLPLYDSQSESGGDLAHDYSETVPDFESRKPGTWSRSDAELFAARFAIEELALGARESGGGDREVLADLFAWISWAVEVLTEFEDLQRDAAISRELLERLAVEAVHDPGFLIIRLMYLSPETSSIENVIDRSIVAGKGLARRVSKEWIHKRFIHYAAEHPEWIPFLCPKSEKVHRLRAELEVDRVAQAKQERNRGRPRRAPMSKGIAKGRRA